ncbi:hypothetical protein GBAR_LOCUS11635 [Geodia barretti]|uniref:Fibronectin type-III domain-containing protein n=1 Tax=Geodia barretti TaxID=519541 RepID=A0AA35WMG3_GEOBA|nr:hypothetical protein GBAR_LOCUS11635 [Geodia barretti]
MERLPYLSSNVYLFISLSALSFAQEILQGPNSTTVFLNQSAVFTCETDRGLAGWRLNGTILEDLSPEIHDDLEVSTLNTAQGSRVENLTIRARAEYNGTRVQCLVIVFGSPSVNSRSANLKIQGRLQAIRGLSATKNTTSLTISWTAPFSLDVTGSDPDIWYSVLIYNVTDENNPTAILCTDCINITETHYTFSPDYTSPCHVYNLSVIPLNGAGQGEGTDLTSSLYDYPIFDHRYLIRSGANVTVFKFPGGNVFRILITAPLFLESAVLCFLDYSNMYYSSTQKHCPSAVSVVFPELAPDSGIWLIDSEVALGKDCDYTVHLTSHNEAGGTNSTATLSISTRVLIVEVEEFEGGVLVRCVFRHTLSERCYVQLVSSEVEGGFQVGWCVEGEGEGVHRFSSLLPATYTVLVYGMVAEGGVDTCSPVAGEPDYITVTTVGRPHPSPVATQPSLTRSLVIANPWGAEGIVVGVCMGAATTCVLFVMGLIIRMVLTKHSERRKGTSELLVFFILITYDLRKIDELTSASSHHVTMERNMAYELHKPLPQRKSHNIPGQCSSQTPNPIYEDLK